MRKNIIKSIIITTGLIMTLGLVGCGKTAEDEMITITDCSGAQVSIPKNFDKVIATPPAFVEFMTAMGQADKLVGTHGSVLGQSWAPLFYEGFSDMALYGYKPTAEEVYAAEADFVVVKNAAYAETLRDDGIPAIYFGYNNLEELYFAVDMMGDIFGPEAKKFAEEWKEYTDKSISQIQSEVSGLSDAEKRNVYYINAAVNPGDLYTTYGGNSFVEYWINTIGANCVTSPYPDIEELEKEVVLSLDPDTIFISGYAEYTRYDELTSDPLWSDKKAVADNEIYLMPTSLVTFDRFAVELPVLLSYSANKIYPDLHEFNGTEELGSFYKEFYGIEFSDEHLNNMLLGLNVDGSRMD